MYDICHPSVSNRFTRVTKKTCAFLVWECLRMYKYLICEGSSCNRSQCALTVLSPVQTRLQWPDKNEHRLLCLHWNMWRYCIQFRRVINSQSIMWWFSVKRYWDVKYKYNEELDVIYFEVKRRERSRLEIFVPWPTKYNICIDKIEKMQQLLQNER